MRDRPPHGLISSPRFKRDSSSSFVAKGTTLLTAEPFAYVLQSELQGQRCDYCFKKPPKLHRCSGCQYVYYCAATCQVKAWKDHKVECPCLRRCQPKVPPNFARLMARILVKLQTGGGEQEEGIINKIRRRKFRDLMSHYDDIKQDLRRMEHFTSVCAVIEDFLPKEFTKRTNPYELLTIYGKICVNSFSIVDGEMTTTGTGIYLAPSILDHSCHPTALAVFDGTAIHIRTIQDIPDFDWSKVVISYIDPLQRTADRKRELQEQYYFECKCPSCLQGYRDLQMGSMKCPKCSDGCVPVAETSHLPCSSCNKEVEDEQLLEKFRSISEFSKENLQKMRQTNYLDVCRTSLRAQEEAGFHPLNILRIKMLDSALDAALYLELWEEAAEYGRQGLLGYKHYLPHYHPLLGCHLLVQGKLEKFLERDPRQVLSLLEEACEILGVTHGKGHSFCHTEAYPLLHDTQAMVHSLMSGQLPPPSTVTS